MNAAAVLDALGPRFGLRAQRIVCARNGETVREVLLGAQGTTPAEVLLAAAAMGLSVDVDRRVLAELHKQPQGLRVGVNLHAATLLDTEGFALTAALAARCGWLHVEVLEHDLLAAHPVVRARLAQLKADSSAQVWLDDFGTGHSLGHLQALAGVVDAVKLDKSYMALSRLPQTRALFSRTVQAAKECGLQVVVEGVETLDDYFRARDCGADWYQGYFLEKPKPL